jgi:hypothetical protein
VGSVLAAGPTDPEKSIQMGDTVTVTFEGATPTPPLTGIIRFYAGDTGAFALEVGTNLHVVSNYAYFTKDIT